MRRWGPLFAVLALLVPAAPAAGDTFTVTTTTDSTDPCSGTDCPSIRSALSAAAQTDVVGDTIVVPPGDYMLTGGELTVNVSVTIEGAGARATRIFMAPSFPDRVFDIGSVTATIEHLTMEGGTAFPSTDFFGGNLRNSGGTVTLSHIRATGGSAYSGGGISNNTGTMVIEHSLIDDNEALNGGGDSGGIQNFGTANAPADLTIRDSTIANNRARNGGGVFAWGDGTIATRLVRTTVTGNQAIAGTLGGIGPGGETGHTFTVLGSIIAGNTPSNCVAPLPTSDSNNVVDTAACEFTSSGDIVADPQLTLYTGGETDVFAIAPTSPAIDRAGDCAGVDQRGMARPQGAACDSGAYEYAAPAPSSPQDPQPPPQDPQPSQQDPQPEFKETVVVDELSGTVTIRLKGTNRFVALDSVRDVPMGSEIDARKGVVELASVAKDDGPPQTATFSEGIFRVTQSGGVTVLTLTEKLACTTANKASAAAKKVKKRRLWGNGKGRFRTRGKHSAATVVGTKWLVEDRCASTLTRVVRGRVKVRDFAKKKTVTVKAGGRYTARRKR
jgi:hypothetical protein